MITIKNPIKYVSGHHIECARASRFSKTPDINDIRSTKLYQYNKKTDEWSPSKLPVNKLNVRDKEIIKEVEDEFTKCENKFRYDIIQYVNEYNIRGLSKDRVGTLSAYIAMNLIRNPDNLTALMERKKMDPKDKELRNYIIDNLINPIANIMFGWNDWYMITTKPDDEILVCPDSIIYAVYKKNDPTERWAIMPLTYNKYLISSYYDNGYEFKKSRLNISFSASTINNLSFKSGFSLICADECIMPQNTPDYEVNDFFYRRTNI